MAMEQLPFDMSHPAVRDYLSLIRLQVLTPLSLLINIATVTICATVVNPSIGGISRLYPSSISPKPAVIALYFLAIYIGQIGYCVLLVLVSKPETKRTVVKGVGLALVLANWVMAAWAIAWTLQYFLLSTILLGILLLLLLYSNINLLVYHAPTSSRPFDTALIHAPLRFFLILPLSLLFPYSLLINLHLTYEPTPIGIPDYYHGNPWPGFGVVMGTNILGLAVIILRHDVVWCVAATWVCVSVWSLRPKPAPVYIVVILFTVLHPLALFAAIVYSRVWARGRVALPLDDPADGVVDGGGHARDGPREVDAEALWG